MGSSMAENHPVGFQWVVAARERGAKIIHVDPRFTRTSAMADIWVPLRAGSDIIFLGGLIHYVLEHGKEFREYVVNYTNAPTILRDDFRDTEDLDGLFSGWDADKRKYSPETWLYEGAPSKETGGEKPGHSDVGGGHGKDRGGEAEDAGKFEADPSLEHPRCVFQVLKRHFSRYTPEMVERYCGVPKEVFLKTAEAFTSASGPEKTGAICYAVGWTQHSNGVQIIRSAAILQLLLGNIGRPGGGILALRGHASIQGSTDIPTLYDILPGYLPMPYFESDSRKLKDYIKKHKARAGLWANFDKYFISLLKAYYGEAASAENEFGFKWLPRVTGDHSHFGYWLEMADGKMEGLFVMGQNPAVGAPNGRLQRKALAKLKWLVVRDMVETETASFWYDSPEVERGELAPQTIGTEVFLFPAAGTAEKEGTFTNTQRLLQYRKKAVEPPGDARSETWFMYHLGRRLKEKAKKDARPRNAGLNALTWNYSTEGQRAEPKVEEVLQEINGYSLADHKLLENYKSLKNDGSTSCGAWIYSGVFPQPGENKANKREPRGYLGHGWGFAWLKDCPLPTHYEPLESPVSNPLYPKQQTDPAAEKKERSDNPYADSPGDPRFPYVLTTYRLTEHHTAGGMSRTLSHLAELQPELFTEVSPELAAEAGLEHGDWATITTPRGIVEARVMVTRRMRAMWVDGRRIHHVGLPYHWGYRGLVTGDIANDLLSISEEPNVRIMEAKALVCNLTPGRRACGAAALTQLAAHMKRTSVSTK